MRARLTLAPLLALATACGPTTAEFVRRPSAPIAWPEPEARPRVEVEFVYHSDDDVERHGGFLHVLRELVLGRDEPALSAPYGLARSGAALLIADTALAAVHVLDLSNGAHRIVRGSAGEPLETPIGIAAVPDDRFFVTDSSRARLFEFSAEGELLNALGNAAELGRPTGIAYDALHERLLVTDTTGGRLVAFDLVRRVFEAFGARGDAPGEFNYPTNVAVDREGRVYVTDSLNFRVQILSDELAPLASFGIPGTGPGAFAKAKGIALDSQGHVYVVDGLFDNVQVFDREGQLLLAVCASGQALGELTLPTGLCIDEQDRIFVADAGNARIQVLRFHP
jgi:sugar lactone lactonase YvrE